MDSTIPSASVIAKPRTLPLPKIYRIAAAIRVVIFPSKIAENAFWKPSRMEELMDFPAAISSRIRA